MSRSAIATSSAPRAIGPYSQAIVAGDLVFCSGQGAIDAATNEMRPGTIEEETRITLKNIGGLLDAAGVGFADVVKSTVFMATSSRSTAPIVGARGNAAAKRR